MEAVPFSRSRSLHRSPKASPRRHPVNAIKCKTTRYGVSSASSRLCQSIRWLDCWTVWPRGINSFRRISEDQDPAHRVFQTLPQDGMDVLNAAGGFATFKKCEQTFICRRCGAQKFRDRHNVPHGDSDGWFTQPESGTFQRCEQLRQRLKHYAP